MPRPPPPLCLKCAPAQHQASLPASVTPAQQHLGDWSTWPQPPGPLPRAPSTAPPTGRNHLLPVCPALHWPPPNSHLCKERTPQLAYMSSVPQKSQISKGENEEDKPMKHRILASHTAAVHGLHGLVGFPHGAPRSAAGFQVAGVKRDPKPLMLPSPFKDKWFPLYIFQVCFKLAFTSKCLLSALIQPPHCNAVL